MHVSVTIHSIAIILKIASWLVMTFFFLSWMPCLYRTDFFYFLYLLKTQGILWHPSLLNSFKILFLIVIFFNLIRSDNIFCNIILPFCCIKNTFNEIWNGNQELYSKALHPRPLSQYPLSQHIIFSQYNNIMYIELEVSVLKYAGFLCLQ